MSRIFLSILLAGFVLRMGLALARDSSDATALASLPDQREYLELGRNLLKGRLMFYDRRLDMRVYAFRAPGYPMFIAACGGNIRAIRVAQAILDALTILAAYLLARRFLPPASSVFATLFVAFNPYLVYFSSLILSETLFIALLAWGIYFLATQRMWWMGSALLAISLLVRPGAMLLPVLLAFASAAHHRDQLVRPLVTSALMIIALFPWAYRNSYTVGSWIWTTTNSGFTLYDGFNPDATGASDMDAILAYNSDLQRTPSEVKRSKFLAEKARQFIDANPGRCIVLGIRKIARTWSPVPLSKEGSNNALIVAASAIYSVPLFALALAGLVIGKLSARAKVYLLCPAIYLTVIHALSVGSIRYRLPADVPMAVIAASAMARGRRSEVRGQK